MASDKIIDARKTYKPCEQRVAPTIVSTWSFSAHSPKQVRCTLGAPEATWFCAHSALPPKFYSWPQSYEYRLANVNRPPSERGKKSGANARGVRWAVKKLLLICVSGDLSEPAFDSAARHRIFVSSQPRAERGGEAALWRFETGNTIYAQ